MTREEFRLRLEECNISSDRYCFDELLGRDDIYWLREAHGIWEVGYIERGKESDYHRFPSESDALQFLIDERFCKKFSKSKKQLAKESEEEPIIYL